MTEEEKRKRRCCFTGHRPEKLQNSETEIAALLRIAILQAIQDGFKTFITGMARGVDIWAAELVLAFQETNPDIHLICALPYPDFDSHWQSTWRAQYQSVLQRADLIRIICPTYSIGCYQVRNKWMVDRAARLIAVYNGKPGGTRNTIEYAERQGVPVVKCLAIPKSASV